MEYKGHPVLEPTPEERTAQFHERRGHGAITVKFATQVRPDDAARQEREGARTELESVRGLLDAERASLPSGLPNGIWTIEGPRGHRTFRISTVLAPGAPQTREYSPASQGDLTFRERHKGKRVLELLTGPDNTANYKGLAWIVDPRTRRDGSCVGGLWKLGLQNSVLVNTFCKLIERAEPLPGYTVHFAKNCLKCNRLLTTPESSERGIGPVCARGGWDG